MNNSDIKIFITYKDKHKIIDNDVVTPIQTGRSIAREKFEEMIGDDTGDNISNKNEEYCELSALYWAWKNPESFGNPKYVGFMHYRRLLNFSEKTISDIKDLNYKKDFVYNKCKNYDIIVSDKLGAYSKTLGRITDTIAEQWYIEHKKEDMDFIYNRVISLYPEYKEPFDRVLNSNKIYWYNIFIMKNNLFSNYCEWLFNVLEIDTSAFSETHRIKGYLAEILLNVFIEKHLRQIKLKEIPLFRYNERQEIPIALTSSEEYAPFCATTMLSILKNIKKNSEVKFYIFTPNLKKTTRKKLTHLKTNIPYKIKFIDISENNFSMFDGINVAKHVGKMSFVRLLIPEFIKNEEKIIFIDCDTLVVGDISELFNIDLKDKLIGAVEDVNKSQLSLNLQLPEDSTYVNAGVLLINLTKLKTIDYLSRLKECINQNFSHYLCSDQCLLNDAFRDNIMVLSTKWNMHHHFHFLKNRFLPNNTEDYERSCTSPKIIHFVGRLKPWMVEYSNEYKDLYRSYLVQVPFKNKFYRKNPPKWLLQQIFSVKNDNKKTHKIVTVLGIKIKFKRQPKLLDVINNRFNEQKFLVANLKTVMLAQQIHKDTFGPYKNAFIGKDIVIVCTGPSARTLTRDCFRKDAIFIGINGACRLPQFDLDYLFMQDNTINQPGNESLTSEVIAYNNSKGNAQKFFAYMPAITLRRNLRSARVLLPIPYQVTLNDSNNNIHTYVLDDMCGKGHIEPEIENMPIANLEGTAFSAIQFAFYTNPKRIFLVGCDCTSGYAYNGTNYIPSLTSHAQKWRQIKEFRDLHYPEIEIISVNPVGLRGLFEDMDTKKTETNKC